MERDARGLAISLLGLAVFVVGVGLLIDLTYFENILPLQAIEGLGLLVPNLVVGGYGLMELGRYYGTAGGTEESNYFGPRFSVLSGRNPAAVEPRQSNATALWFRVLWVGLAGQVVWAGLTLAGLVEGFPGQVLRYTTLLATVLAAYYDIQYVAKCARWPWPQRWLVGFAVFPVNLAIAVAYVRLRRQRLTEAGPCGGDGDATRPTDGTDRSWATPGWHYVVALATVGWLPILLVRDIAIGTGPLVAVAILAVWLALPVAIALDSRKFTDSTWIPKRRRWIIGGLLPVCNLVVGPAYLLRRYETTR
ncbi:hypothetical protein M0R89_11670 [Halorussus limi]|uniref:Uncharacterized protein n=1 Tax=Halorussus limi TaxID=2938695 RepID=A0A8U0HR41_9EURY|nr:hypothetical protein [Halorussus limi]UPV73206.1 hypothetical protein M0R89_11670 [Halorussus limi]